MKNNFKHYSKRFLFSLITVVITVILVSSHTFKSIHVASNLNIPYIWDEIKTQKKDYIKWIDFNVCYDALDAAYRLDVNSK